MSAERAGKVYGRRYEAPYGPVVDMSYYAGPSSIIPNPALHSPPPYISTTSMRTRDISLLPSMRSNLSLQPILIELLLTAPTLLLAAMQAHQKLTILIRVVF